MAHNFLMTAGAPDRGTRILALFGSRVIFGAERENIEWLAAVQQRGCEVLCLVRQEPWNDQVPAALASRGLASRKTAYIDAWLPGWRLWILLRNPVAFLAGNWQFLRTVRDFRPTHLHAFNPFFVLSFLPAIMLTRIPLIYRCGDVPVRHRWIWQLLWRIVVRRTRRFAAISRFIAAELQKSGVPPDRISVIYGIPPARTGTPRGTDSLPGPGAQDIVFIGQIVPEKGPQLLIDAFCALAPRHASSRLLIAGRISDWQGDDWARDLRARAKADPVAGDRILFLGFVDDVPGLLRGRMVLAAPTVIDEALGLVVLEAKAAAVPAIVFPSGGLPEMIEPGVDGLVCEQANVGALSEALTRYLDDPSLAARHGTAARASLQRFSPDRFASLARALYESA